MKRGVWFFAILLVLLWASTPFWVPHIAHKFLAPEAAAEPGAPAAPNEAAARVSSRDHAIAGQFGDMFSTINSLFSGFALIGVAYGLYLQIEQKRREKQPEVFARLATKDTEQQLVLAPMDATPGGEVYLTLTIPVYITTGSSAAAFNVSINVDYSGLIDQVMRLPVPVLAGTETQDEMVIQLIINASKLAGAAPAWRLRNTNECSLGELEVKIEFENQQQAKWQITARYAIATRSPADNKLLEDWINNATVSSGGARSIELESRAISWTPKEL